MSVHWCYFCVAFFFHYLFWKKKLFFLFVSWMDYGKEDESFHLFTGYYIMATLWLMTFTVLAFWWQVNSDVFTSTRQMAKFVSTEQQIIAAVEKFIDQEESRLQRLRRYVIHTSLLRPSMEEFHVSGKCVGITLQKIGRNSTKLCWGFKSRWTEVTYAAGRHLQVTECRWKTPCHCGSSN